MSTNPGVTLFGDVDHRKAAAGSRWWPRHDAAVFDGNIADRADVVLRVDDVPAFAGANHMQLAGGWLKPTAMPIWRETRCSGEGIALSTPFQSQ
jgi:hypothetical protein